MSISVVIPTMNEEKTIGDVIKSLQYLNPVEVFVVDTNSTDRTREIAESMGATVVDEPRRGYGRAYKTGIMKCSGDIVVCLDGDGTYPCNVIKPLIEILDANQVDFISCDRMTLRSQNSYTNLHLIGNKILNFSISVLYGYRLFDSQSGMWNMAVKFFTEDCNTSIRKWHLKLAIGPLFSAQSLRMIQNSAWKSTLAKTISCFTSTQRIIRMDAPGGTNMSISVVIPTMNEEKTIGDVIKSLQYLNPVEVFVVDTNSTDRTREIAESMGATIVDEPRRGYGRAYKTGIMKCTGDIVFAKVLFQAEFCDLRVILSQEIKST